MPYDLQITRLYLQNTFISSYQEKYLESMTYIPAWIDKLISLYIYLAIGE